MLGKRASSAAKKATNLLQESIDPRQAVASASAIAGYKNLTKIELFRNNHCLLSV